MPHPHRLIGKAQLLDVEGQVIREVECNHHSAYYKAIFDAMEKAVAKNNDYAGGCDSHPMANFLQTEDSGILPRTGLWVRMTDKIGRIKTFFRTGKLAVKDEPVTDAFSDLGNYAFLMLALLEEDEPPASLIDVEELEGASREEVLAQLKKDAIRPTWYGVDWSGVDIDRVHRPRDSMRVPEPSPSADIRENHDR